MALSPGSQIKNYTAATAPEADWYLVAQDPNEGTASLATKSVLISDLLKGNASTALDNLASVAINTSLISDTDATDSLGSAAKKWLEGFLNRITIEEGGSTATPAAGDVALYAKADGLLYSKDDAGVETQVSGGAGGGGGGLVMGGRLSLTSGTPVTTSDVTDATSLYWAPYGSAGGYCSLFDGSAWQTDVLTELTDTNAGFTTSKPHDIFIDYNGGTPVLDKLAWTNGTTRATALTTQDGRYVLTGALDWNYIGTVYLDSADKFQDARINRLVWNYYNRTQKYILSPYNSTSTSYGTAAWRIYNNDSSIFVGYINGVLGDTMSTGITTGNIPLTGNHALAIGDNTTSAVSFGDVNPSSFSVAPGFYTVPVIGYHAFNLIQNAQNGTAGDYSYATFAGLVWC